MMQKKFDRILETIARQNHTTPEQVRREMQHTMKAGQQNSDPIIQARWNAIPHRGEELTLEEFVEYLVSKTGSIML